METQPKTIEVEAKGNTYNVWYAVTTEEKEGNDVNFLIVRSVQNLFSPTKVEIQSSTLNNESLLEKTVIELVNQRFKFID